MQGIWNKDVDPPWRSNYTVNIHTEMNYWLAETCNLEECHEPLFDLLEGLCVSGRKTEEIHYGCRGWTAHHNVDLWRMSTPAAGSASWAFWPMGGAWLCRHLWERYLFEGDAEFLAAKAYPIMRTIELWPGASEESIGEENQGCPSLNAYPVHGEEPSPAIIVCPGGRYLRLAAHEGEPVAKWLNGLGISALS